jgi:transcriptional regulator with XRE-family HTH domain
MTPAIRIGRNIRRIRRAADLSQEACAEWAGIHKTNISLYETGLRQPKLDSVLRIAGALKVEPGVLLEGVRWVPSVYGDEGFAYEEDA